MYRCRICLFAKRRHTAYAKRTDFTNCPLERLTENMIMNRLRTIGVGILTGLALTAASVLAAEPELLFENSDFENGTLKNWKAEGAAFDQVQPTKGDNPKARRRESSKHQGEYWIGGYERYDGKTGSPGDMRGDRPTGTLTSIPFVLQKKYLCFRVGGGADLSQLGVHLLVDGKEEQLTAGYGSETMTLVSVDVSAYKAKTVQLKIVDRSSGGWGHINVDDFRASDKLVGQLAIKGMKWNTFPSYLSTGYDQVYRPQFHFTSRRNWINDPNGMVHYDGEYHLFFQHNPKGINWGNMTWGHAISSDMVHWKQIDHAITPYGGGTIYSGTGTIDHNNTLGKQKDQIKTIIACFTLAKRPYYQAIAFSTDKGRTFELLNDGKAVIPNQGFDQGERDPKLFWHAASKKWVVVLWVKAGRPGCVRFFTSENLVDWTVASDFRRDWVYECMDFVQLSVDGDPKNKKWLLYDASFEYEIGKFDGKTFTTDKKAHRGEYGRNFYAAQSFSNSPDGRTVMIGWMRGSDFNKKGMPFNQQMSFPTTMELQTTEDGIRLFRAPAKEIEKLYSKSHRFENLNATDAAKKLSGIKAELLDVSLEFDPADLTLNLRGLQIRYNHGANVFEFGKVRLPAPAIDGKVKLRALVDRGSLELFSNDGAAVATSYALPSPTNKSLSMTVGENRIHELVIHELTSSWGKSTSEQAIDE